MKKTQSESDVEVHQPSIRPQLNLREQGRIESILRLLASGFAYEFIAAKIGCTVNRVQELDEQLKAAAKTLPAPKKGRPKKGLELNPRPKRNTKKK